MFKSTRRKIAEMIFDSTIKTINEQRACETCGCLIAPGLAVAGVKEIRKQKKYVTTGYFVCNDYYYTDYIYTPYYCKGCAPKVKK